MKLSELAHGKDNNFNLIRFLAAFAVLTSHSFALATGSGNAEPLYLSYGCTWGDIAVDVFFVTSGFLVTASLATRKNAAGFAWARILRIFPALWIMLILSVFALGLALTTWEPSAYLTAHQTWKYLLKNAVLLRGVEFTLPGLFHGGGVNGSLWTLRPEVEMYVLLLATWLAARRYFLPAVIIIVGVFGAWYLVHGNFSDPQLEFPRLAFLFFVGAAFYLLKERIVISGWLFWTLLIAALLSAFNRTVFFFAVSLALPYVVMYAAYAFGGPVRAFNRLGDYSYGVYIYAFPVQQAVAYLSPGISIALLFVLSGAITLTLAVLSWHLLEKRVLGLKDVPTLEKLALFRTLSNARTVSQDAAV